jgi:hypothetical protein
MVQITEHRLAQPPAELPQMRNHIVRLALDVERGMQQADMTVDRRPNRMSAVQRQMLQQMQPTVCRQPLVHHPRPEPQTGPKRAGTRQPVNRYAVDLCRLQLLAAHLSGPPTAREIPANSAGCRELAAEIFAELQLLTSGSRGACRANGCQ